MPTLLICDDSGTMLDVLSHCLSQRYTVVTAPGGIACLRIARSQAVDAILCDVMMPEMDGYETCRALKADPLTCAIPVIFMTASGIPNKLPGFEAGGVDFVEKPGDDTAFAELCARLDTHLIIQRQRRELEAANFQLEAANIQLETQHRQLLATQQQLIVQAKLASLGELVAGISHEIKNPLTVVCNYSQSLVELTNDLQAELVKPDADRDRAELDFLLPKLPEIARKIKTHGDRAVRIVQGMLEHSRGERGTRQPTDLNLLVKEYVNLAYHGLRGQDQAFNTEIRFALQSALTPVVVIPQDISRAVVNIASNALQAVRAKCARLSGITGGITGGINGYRPTVSVSTSDHGATVTISIRDNGDGIPPNVVDRIFEPFFTTKPTGEGTGLGLSMAYEIVTQEHGGTLTCQSQVGEWTEFTITLPKEEVERLRS